MNTLDVLNEALDRINRADALMARAHARCPACRHPLSDHHYDDDGLWGCIAVDGRVVAQSIATGAGPVCGCTKRFGEETA